VDSVVIRAGDFFGGTGSGTWLDMAIASKISKGKFTYPGNPDIAHAWAYLPDLAQTFVRVANQRAQLRGHHRLNFGGHTFTGHALQAALESLVGQRLRFGTMPWGLIRIASPFMPMWRELMAMRYLWERPHELDDQALRRLIGAVPHTPLHRALQSALAEMQPAEVAPTLGRA
jgi:nucleoside-diphosphate-sugar epimerase